MIVKILRKVFEQLRGKGMDSAAHAVILMERNYCGSAGRGHNWSSTELSSHVWLDWCEDCGHTTLLVTNQARIIKTVEKL